MPLNLQNLIHTPSPVRQLDLTGMFGSPGNTAREQLKLAREKFEWDKKRADEEDEYNKMKLGAEQARHQAEAEATKAAKLQEDRLKVFGEFSKASGEGNVEAVQSMVPLMASLGMGIELEGEEGGLPRYRVDMDAAAAQKAEDERAAQTSPYGENETAEQSLQRLGAMGLGGETGSLQPPLGIRASEEVDPATGQSVADRVSATYGMPGEKTATRAPDTQDFTGGVPKNVVDMGAMADATLARLDPALQGMAAAYPDKETRLGADAIRTGLRSSGLPFEKQAALFGKAAGDVASQRNAQIAAQAQSDRFRETRDQLTPMDMSTLRSRGENSAQALAKEMDVKGAAQAITTADEILDLLDDPSKENDTMIAGALMSIQNVKGIPSDRDLAMAFGMDKASTVTQILDYIGTKVQGGFQPEQREAIKSFVKRVTETQRSRAYDFLDSSEKAGDLDENERRGYLGGMERAVPSWLRQEYEEDRQKSKGKKSAAMAGTGKTAQNAPGDVTSDFDIELESQAMENDLDPAKVARIIGPESGGRADARNKDSGATGLIQFLPSVAESLGTSTDALAKMSSAEQLPFVMRYLSERGVTSDSPPEDYAMAVAAPNFIGKPPDTVVYAKGSKAWEQNPAWRPKDGGDITVGSIQGYYDRGSKAKGAETPKTALPEPTTPAEKRLRELREREGR